ncbi:MAG: hypothetical protein MHM6MM_007278 [Cercozoa sp. M6MM]
MPCSGVLTPTADHQASTQPEKRGELLMSRIVLRRALQDGVDDADLRMRLRWRPRGSASLVLRVAPQKPHERALNIEEAETHLQTPSLDEDEDEETGVSFEETSQFAKLHPKHCTLQLFAKDFQRVNLSEVMRHEVCLRSSRRTGSMRVTDLLPFLSEHERESVVDAVCNTWSETKEDESIGAVQRALNSFYHLLEVVLGVSIVPRRVYAQTTTKDRVYGELSDGEVEDREISPQLRKQREQQRKENLIQDCHLALADVWRLRSGSPLYFAGCVKRCSVAALEDVGSLGDLAVDDSDVSEATVDEIDENEDSDTIWRIVPPAWLVRMDSDDVPFYFVRSRVVEARAGAAVSAAALLSSAVVWLPGAAGTWVPLGLLLCTSGIALITMSKLNRRRRGLPLNTEPVVVSPMAAYPN